MKYSTATSDFPAWSHRLGPMKARLAATGSRLRQATLSQLEARLGSCLPDRLLAKAAAGPHSRDRIYSLSRTFWGWLWQRLNHNASCREAVRQVQALCALQGGPFVHEDTGGYCQARAHLPQPLLEKALVASALSAARRAPALPLLGARPLKGVDGSSLRLPDTPANQKRFPQPPNQKRGCGFPVMKLVVLFCLTSGALLARATGTLWESEACLLHRLLAALNLENAVQPRMDTDGHGYQAVARNRRLTQEVNENRSPKSVFIRVHPWLMIFSADSNCGI